MTAVKADGKVEFRFFRPHVSKVEVAGDFNGWRGELPMRPQGGGWWQATAELKPGEYRFRYLADGAWFTDFASHGVEYKSGTWNGVLVVPRRHIEREEAEPASRRR